MDLTLYTCPITYQIFYEPVIAEDGHTYERDAIERWMKSNIYSPITREYLGKKVIPNYNAKSNVSKLLEEHPEYINDQYVPVLTRDKIINMDNKKLLFLIKTDKIKLNELIIPNNNYLPVENLMNILVSIKRNDKYFLKELIKVAFEKEYNWNLTTTHGYTTLMECLKIIKEEDILMFLLNNLKNYNWGYKNKFNKFNTHIIGFKCIKSSVILKELIKYIDEIDINNLVIGNITLPMIIFKNVIDNDIINVLIDKLDVYNWDIIDLNGMNAFMYAIKNKNITNDTLTRIINKYRNIKVIT